MHRSIHQVTRLQAPASAAEERAFDTLVMLAMPARLPSLEQHNSTYLHFKTTLLKTLFSSPMACLDTLRSHLHRLQRGGSQQSFTDLRQLRSLEQQLGRINAADFSKYQHLLRWIEAADWHGDDCDDRLVICTERLETLFFLSDRLQQDLELAPEAVELLHAGLRLDQRAEVLASFRHRRRPVRLLLCADIASARLPLHPLSHRLVHFDLPWSPAVIRQRNARIDHPQQQRPAQITYLHTDSRNPCVRAKQEILQGLLKQPCQPPGRQPDQSRNTQPSDLEMRNNCVREAAATAAAIERGEFVGGPRTALCKRFTTEPIGMTSMADVA